MAGTSGQDDLTLNPPPNPEEQAFDQQPEPEEAPAFLLERMRERPYGYRFFQLVRLLQATNPDRAPVGGFADPRREAARFSAHQTLSYPPSEVSRIETPPGNPPRVEVNFLGLTGPVGELPVFYTAYLMERLRSRDRAAVDFFDIFNHRLVSLFYRAWEKQRFAVRHERGDDAGLRQYVLDFLGLGTKGLQDRQSIEDSALIFYAGLLNQRPRSAQALENLIGDYFDVPVEVIQFVGTWRTLDESSLCRLEEDPERGGFSTQLGVGAVAGDEVWDPQSAARIRIGPLPLDRYLEFLPSGAAYPALNSLARLFAGLEIDFEVQLVLKREDVPEICLGAEGGTAPKLGWVTWVKSVPLRRDPDETVYRLQQEEPSHGR
jgi:type VI secretion system protein ImpH